VPGRRKGLPHVSFSDSEIASDTTATATPPSCETPAEIGMQWRNLGSALEGRFDRFDSFERLKRIPRSVSQLIMGSRTGSRAKRRIHRPLSLNDLRRIPNRIPSFGALKEAFRPLSPQLSRRYRIHEELLVLFYTRRAQGSLPGWERTHWVTDPLARWRDRWRVFGVLLLLLNFFLMTSAAWAQYHCEADRFCRAHVCPSSAQWAQLALSLAFSPVSKFSQFIPVSTTYCGADRRDAALGEWLCARGAPPSQLPPLHIGNGCYRELLALLVAGENSFTHAAAHTPHKRRTNADKVPTPTPTPTPTPSPTPSLTRSPTPPRAAAVQLFALAELALGLRTAYTTRQRGSTEAHTTEDCYAYGTSAGVAARTMITLDLLLVVPWHALLGTVTVDAMPPQSLWFEGLDRWLAEQKLVRTLEGFNRLRALPPASVRLFRRVFEPHAQAVHLPLL